MIDLICEDGRSSRGGASWLQDGGGLAQGEVT